MGRADSPLPPPLRPGPHMPRRDSASAKVRRALRDDIVFMRRKPGESISEKAIAATFGLSRTPVREALLALSDEGLIDIFPQSGTFIAKIPLNGLPEAMLIRDSLEVTIVRLAAERSTAQDATRLNDHLDRQRKAAASGDLYGFYQLDEDFHGILAALAGYPGVWLLVQQVKYQIDRFRQMTLGMDNRPAGIINEHAAIADAIRAGNPEQAAAAMLAHLATVRTGLEAARALHPDYFSEDPPDRSILS